MNKDLKDIIYKDNYEFALTLENIYKNLNINTHNFKSFKEWTEYWGNLFETFLNTNLNMKERIVFFLKASLTNNANIPNDVKEYVFPHIIRKYIVEYPQEVLKIFEDEIIQTLYCNWFKIIEKDFNPNKESKNIYIKIFSLPKFKEIVLNDYSFVVDLFKYNFKDYLTFIPNNYNYLIGAVNSIVLDKKELLKFYNAFFKNKLSKNEISNLVDVHVSIDRDKKLLNTDIKYKKEEYISCLKDVYINPEYFKLLKKLSKKLRIDLKNIMLFSSKYKDTEMFLNLFNQKSDAEIAKKILYLANSKKISNMDLIKSLNTITLNELILVEKDENVKIKVYGGPNSVPKGKNTFFKDSYEREIRRINIDGTYKIKSLSNTNSHFDGVKNIYSDYKINEEFNTTTDISIDFAKKYNSITFIIEKEICFIIMPTTLTTAQKEILINWLLSSNKKVQLGIALCNKETNKNDVISNEFMSKNEIIEYIKNIEEINYSKNR